MANMGFRIIDGSIVVAVHTAEAPEDDVWDAYVDAYIRNTSPLLSIVVFTDGGKPTREQFARLGAVRGNRDLKTLIVSANVAARIVGTMVSALLRFNASFSAPENVFDSLASLGITDIALAQRVLEEAESIAKELSPDTHLDSLATRRGATRAY